MMTFRKPLLPLLITGLLLCAGSVTAQDTPPPPTSAPMPMPPTPAPADQPMPAASPDQAMPAASASAAAPANVTVRSVPPPPPVIGPAPTFEQLSGGGKTISADQAVAYPPLANDFINADTNRNGKVSKAEYGRWIKQL